MSDHASGSWLPLMDYAIQKRMSLSTLRRYIKAGKVTHRLVNGRYFLLDEGPISTDVAQSVGAQAAMIHTSFDASQSLHEKVSKLEADLQRAREEIAELKMLVDLYEEKIPGRGQV